MLCCTENSHLWRHCKWRRKSDTVRLRPDPHLSLRDMTGSRLVFSSFVTKKGTQLFLSSFTQNRTLCTYIIVHALLQVHYTHTHTHAYSCTHAHTHTYTRTQTCYVHFFSTCTWSVHTLHQFIWTHTYTFELAIYGHESSLMSHSLWRSMKSPRLRTEALSRKRTTTTPAPSGPTHTYTHLHTCRHTSCRLGEIRCQ